MAQCAKEKEQVRDALWWLAFDSVLVKLGRSKLCAKVLNGAVSGKSGQLGTPWGKPSPPHSLIE